jgi:hypothetical protein
MQDYQNPDLPLAESYISTSNINSRWRQQVFDLASDLFTCLFAIENPLLENMV